MSSAGRLNELLLELKALLNSDKVADELMDSALAREVALLLATQSDALLRQSEVEYLVSNIQSIKARLYPPFPTQYYSHESIELRRELQTAVYRMYAWLEDNWGVRRIKLAVILTLEHEKFDVSWLFTMNDDELLKAVQVGRNMGEASARKLIRIRRTARESLRTDVQK